jgi:hypothetical protein
VISRAGGAKAEYNWVAGPPSAIVEDKQCEVKMDMGDKSRKLPRKQRKPSADYATKV